MKSIKPWVPSEERFVREHYRRMSVRAIAEKLGRTASAVYRWADRDGIMQRRRAWTEDMDARARKLHAEGWSDAEISDEVGFCRRAVGEWRQRGGLGSNANSQRRRDAVAALTRLQCEDNGVASLAEIRSVQRRMQAVRRGWPAECTPRMCDVLDQLLIEPKTRRDLCAAIGVRWHRCKALQTSNGKSVLQALIDLGLVERCGRLAYGAGKGKTQYVYALAAGIVPSRPRPVADERSGRAA